MAEIGQQSGSFPLLKNFTTGIIGIHTQAIIASLKAYGATGVNPYEWTAGKVNFSPMAVD